MFVSIFIQSTVFIAVVVLVGGAIGWLTRGAVHRD